MRIGVNCYSLEPHIGGLKQYFSTLFDWLFEHDTENEYVLFYFRQNIGELTKLRSDKWKAKAVLLDNQDQITVHLKNLDLYFCPFCVLWPRPVALPSVMTLVDIQEVFYPQFFSAADLHVREYHYPSSTRSADRVVTISEFSKSTFVEHHDISPEKIVVAHLCADPSYFRAPEIQSPPPTPIPFARFVFFPANRWLHKNHDVLLRTLAVLNDRGVETNAVFTGFDVDGGYSISKKAAEYNVSQHVHSAGYVTVPQMAYLYQHAEMLVFPSLFEGFGMPPIEAMAAGCPVVVSTSTCLPEICGEAADYFDPNDPIALADAICRVRENPIKREELIQRGHAQAKLFSVERMARTHLEAFAQATIVFSKQNYWWHRFYQPYHRLRVDLKQKARRYRLARRPPPDWSFAFSKGWYVGEQDGSNWLRWTGGRGKLDIHVPNAIRLRVKGEIASIALPNEVNVFINGKLFKTWPVEGEFGFGSIPDLVAELTAGKNTIEFVSKKPGVWCGPNDPRTLAIAVRNLSLSDLEKGKEIARAD
jgi:glycosyltransferase involved in cell wall biosynthesis